MDNMEKYNLLRHPPETALKKITGGRLSGFTDVKPQWRYEVMTEVYGPCGKGWRYTIDRLWSEPGCDLIVFAFAQISLQTWDGVVWSSPIPGIGGSQLIEKEKSGMHSNDEAYKMAVTDALSVAMKMLGVAADIYAGMCDGSKYRDPLLDKPPAKPPDIKSKAPMTDKAYLDSMAKAKTFLHDLTGSDDIYYQALKIYQIQHAAEIADRAQGEQLLKDLRNFVKAKQAEKKAEFPPEV